MDLSTFFLSQYEELTSYIIPAFWDGLTQEQMRQRPEPHLNSVAWNIFHMTRNEDVFINRLVAERSQVWDDPSWSGKVGISFRYQGTAMTDSEVDQLSASISLDALREYRQAVTGRTKEVVTNLDGIDLASTPDHDYVRWVVVDQGMMHPSIPADRVIDRQAASTRGNALLSAGLAHNYLHVGEIWTLKALLTNSED